MNCENARVAAIEKDSVWLETLQQNACAACSAKSACGQSLLNKIFKGKRHYFKVSTAGFTEPLDVHDEVEIAVDDHVLTFGALLLYGLPLVFMIAGALISDSLGSPSELITILATLAGFVAGLALVAVFSFINRKNPKFQPKLSRVVKHNQATSQAITFKP